MRGAARVGQQGDEGPSLPRPINQDTNGTGYGGYTVTGTGYGGYSVTGPGYGGYPDTGTGYGGDYASSTSGGDGDGGDVVFDGSLGCTPGCAQTLVNGGTGVCSGSPALARMDLLGCACSPDACQVSCGFNICVYEAVTATCMQCLQTNCAAQLSTCEEN